MPNRPMLRAAPTLGCFAASCVVVALQQLAHARRALDEAVLLVDLDRRQRRGAGQRVRVVGQAAVEDVVLEVLGDLAAHARARPSWT